MTTHPEGFPKNDGEQLEDEQLEVIDYKKPDTQMHRNAFGNFDPEKEKQKDSNAGIILEQLQSGEVSHFDQKTVKLLDSIKKDQCKSRIVSGARNMIVGLASLALPVAAGIEAADIAADAGHEYAAKQVNKQFEKLLINSDTVKSLPKTAFEATKAEASELINQVPHMPEVKERTSGAWSKIKRGASFVKNKVTGTTQNLREKSTIVDGTLKKGGAVAHYAHEKVASTSEALKGKLEDFTNTGVDATVNTVNNYLLNPTFHAASESVGYAASIPAGAIGYIIGGTVVGGTFGVMGRRRKERSFSAIKPTIEAAEKSIDDQDFKTEDGDPRLRLLAKFDRIATTKNHGGKNYTTQEWLKLVAIVREARISLLQEKTNAPEIIAHQKVRDYFEYIGKVIDTIINNQKLVAQQDLETAAQILAQFDPSLQKDIAPYLKDEKRKNHLLIKSLGYTNTFVKSGFKATGVPLLWKTAKTGVKGGLKVGAAVATGGVSLIK